MSNIYKHQVLVILLFTLFASLASNKVSNIIHSFSSNFLSQRADLHFNFIFKLLEFKLEVVHFFTSSNIYIFNLSFQRIKKSLKNIFNIIIMLFVIYSLKTSSLIKSFQNSSINVTSTGLFTQALLQKSLNTNSHFQ